MVGYTLLSVYLFIRLFFLSVPPLPLNPLLPESICCQKHPEYLSTCLSAFLSRCRSEREGSRSVRFPCKHISTRIRISYSPLLLPTATKDVKFEGRRVSFRYLGVAPPPPRDLRTNRDRLARDTLPQDLSIHAKRRLGDVLLLAL